MNNCMDIKYWYCIKKKINVSLSYNKKKIQKKNKKEKINYSIKTRDINCKIVLTLKKTKLSIIVILCPF